MFRIGQINQNILFIVDARRGTSSTATDVKMKHKGKTELKPDIPFGISG